MKKLLLLTTLCTLLFALSVAAQTKTITLGDSILTKDVTTTGNYTMVAVWDTTGGSTDTLVCEYNDAVCGWLPISLKDMKTRTYNYLMIPGDGLKAIYQVDWPTPTDLRVRRTNVSNLTSLTKVKITHLQP